MIPLVSEKKIGICLVVLLTFLTCISAFAEKKESVLKTRKQIIMEAHDGTPVVSAMMLKEKMKRNDNFILIDVRTERERNAGYISGSIWIPRGVLEFKIGSVCNKADTEIILYCRKGSRSALAVKTLQAIGYSNVFNLKGGINGWGEGRNPIYNWHGEVMVREFDKEDPDKSTFDIFDKKKTNQRDEKKN